MNPPGTPSGSSEPAIVRRGAVAVIERQGRLLVIRRAEGIAAPGAFCFPGGGIERGESEEAAVVRELQEELAVKIDPLRRLWRSVTPWGVELFWWLAELHPAAEPVANPAEVAGVYWHTPAEMAALAGLLESNRQFLAAMASGEIALG